MEPQVSELKTDGNTDEPLSNGAEGPSVLGEDWTEFYEGPGSGEMAAWVDNLTDAELLAEAGVQPIVGTSEAAEYFDRTPQWIYWGLKPDPETGEVRFVWPDGSPIVPERIGRGANSKRLFTMPILRAILTAWYQRGSVSDDELKTIIRRIRYTELGVEWREREGWKHAYVGRNRYRWVKPEEAYFDSYNKVWKLRKNLKRKGGK